MSSPLHTRPARLVGALAATLAVLSGSPQAQTVIENRSYPGSHCTSDGATSLTQIGTRINTAPVGGNGYQTFQCPIPLPWYSDLAGYSQRRLAVGVSLLRNPNVAASSCRLSLSRWDIDTVIAEDWAAPNPTTSQTQEAVFMELPLPSNNTWAASAVYMRAHLRCRLYNASTAQNGMIGFTVLARHEN